MNQRKKKSQPKQQRSNVKGGGLKFDADKAPLDLLPYEAEEAIGQVLLIGMKKYGAANWAKGIHYSRLIAATKRHIGQFNSVQDLDAESGLNHIAHAATNLVFLLWMIKNRPDMDDRWMKLLKEGKL